MQRFKAYVKQGELGKARTDLDHALDLDSTFKLARLQRANLRLQSGDCTGATTDYEAVLRADPTKKDAQARLPESRKCAMHLEQADREASLGRWPEVSRHLEEATAPGRAVSSVPALVLASRAQLEQGHIDDAIAMAARALKVDARSLDALAMRAQALYQRGDTEQALTHTQQALRLDPEYEEAMRLHRKLRQVSRLSTRASGLESSGDHAGAA